MEEPQIMTDEPKPQKKSFGLKLKERVRGSIGGQYIREKLLDYKIAKAKKIQLRKKEEESYEESKGEYAVKLGKARARQEYKQRISQYKGKKQPSMGGSSFMGLTLNREVLDFRPSGMAFGASMESPFGNLGEYAKKDRNLFSKTKKKQKSMPNIKSRLY